MNHAVVLFSGALKSVAASQWWWHDDTHTASVLSVIFHVQWLPHWNLCS